MAIVLSTPGLVALFTERSWFVILLTEGLDNPGVACSTFGMGIAVVLLWPVVRSWVKRHSIYVSHAGIWLNTAEDEDRHIPWANVRKAVFDESARLLIVFDVDGRRLLTYENDVYQSNACARRAADTINRLRRVYLKERGSDKD